MNNSYPAGPSWSWSYGS